MRGKPRFTVNLQAAYRINDNGMQQQECRVTNLSASGAAVRFARTESVGVGAVISIDISIPGTIMHIPAEAEIMWTRKRPNELLSGIKFTYVLSDSMIQQLVKKAVFAYCCVMVEPPPPFPKLLILSQMARASP